MRKRSELVERYQAGESAVALAATFGIDRRTATRLIRAAGVEVRYRVQLTDVDIDVARELYEQGLSLVDIGVHLGLAARTVLNLFRRAAVPTRAVGGLYQPGPAFEVEIARRLTETDSPVAEPEPRVEPRVYVRDGFAITLWRYYEPLQPEEVEPREYAQALNRLHSGTRQIDVAAPHFTDRVAEAEWLLGHCSRTPDLPDVDRNLLSNDLRSLRRTIGDRGAAEQLLHGEPHPGNVLRTERGLLFIDLETCCRGPVEFDLADAPEAVADHYRAYRAVDQDLLRECRILVLAMVTTWRWERHDQLPNGAALAREWLSQLRSAVDAYGLETNP